MSTAKRPRYAATAFALMALVATNSLGEEYCGSEHSKNLYFGNGMFNSSKEAWNSINSLKEFLGSDLPPQPIKLAYNTNETALIQLQQVSFQKEEEGRIEFWKNLAHISLAPEWLRKAALYQASRIANESLIKDSDLRIQVESYKSDLTSEKSIVAITHSQGNFYSNLSWQILSKEFSNLKDSMKIVAVATPSSLVAGNGDYTSLTSDGVINAIRKNSGAPPANSENSKKDHWDHEFVKHYLEGDKSAQKIRADILVALRSSGAYLHSSLKPIREWSLKIREKEALLKPEQCLALAALAFQYDNWGKSCEERNIDFASKWLDDCMMSQWIEKDRWDFDYCFVYDIPSTIGGIGKGSSFLQEVLYKHDECKWDKKKLFELINPALVEKAKAFLKDPR